MSRVFLLKQKVFIQEEKKVFGIRKAYHSPAMGKLGLFQIFDCLPIKNVYPVVRAKCEASVSKWQVLSGWAILPLPFAGPFLQP